MNDARALHPARPARAAGAAGAAHHASGLGAAARDGELWKLRVTSVPAPAKRRAYIETALKGREDGHSFAFAVLDAATAGCSAAPATTTSCRRWGGWRSATPGTPRRCQRTHVNTTCKLLLMAHAFEALGCQLVGWRTDNYNFASQRAIERLGASKDGVLRGHALRRDGTIRDTVMYSLRAGEWPEVKAHLQYQLDRPRA